MRIGIITTEYWPLRGGIARYTHELSSTLRSFSGVEKVFIFSRDACDLPDHICIGAPYRGCFWRFLYYLDAFLFLFHLSLRLPSVIQTYKLDVLLVMANSGNLFIRKKKNISIPVIYVMHNSFTQSQLTGIKDIHLPFPVLKFLEYSAYITADRVIFLTSSIASSVYREFKGIQKKGVIIPNGVNRENFFFKNTTKKSYGQLLYVGRISKRKGIDFLVHTMPLIIAQNPRVHLSIIGTGPLEDELKQFIEKAYLENSITFLGWIADDTQLRQCYNKAEILIIPSIFEGMPTVGLEAMACGLPIIATDVQGNRDIVHQGKGGLLVPYGETEKLADAVTKLLADPSLRTSMGIYNRHLVETNYDWRIVAQQIFDVCMVLLKKNE